MSDPEEGPSSRPLPEGWGADDAGNGKVRVWYGADRPGIARGSAEMTASEAFALSIKLIRTATQSLRLPL
jgi:hypothetical protein